MGQNGRTDKWICLYNVRDFEPKSRPGPQQKIVTIHPNFLNKRNNCERWIKNQVLSV